MTDKHDDRTRNVHERTVAGFGEEWSSFDQSGASDSELQSLFENYFSLFPWARLSPGAVGFDFGCGSGRWATFVSERVGELHCIDASMEALEVAKRNLTGRDNCAFHLGSIEEIEIADGSMDFGYSLGVLHHTPDPAAALATCAKKLRAGAPFLGYIYYALENQPVWYRFLWKVSDGTRRVASRLPGRFKSVLAALTAALVYWPLARTARLLRRVGRDTKSFPLSFYMDHSFYVMRNDALDRFGTRLEKRFTRAEISEMCEQAGLAHVEFAEGPPYWRFYARKASTIGS